MEPIEAGGRRLAANVFAPPDGPGRPGLLFVHGLHSDQSGYQARARAVTDALGIVCLTFDLSGHGASGDGLERLTPRDHLVDVTAAYDFLAGHPSVDPARIGVCGASYGGYLAALLAGARAVRRILLRAPGLYGDDAFDRPLAMGRGSGVAAQAMATRNLAAFDGAVRIVESGADEVIPHAVVEAYLKACPGAQHVVLPGAGHALTEPGWRQRFLDEILDFFAAL